MKKLICRPYLSLVFILFALFFPVEAWAELYFMYSAGGPQVTEKSVNWSERGSNILSWPIAVYDGKAVTVTYSSGDVNKATVDNNGIVTIISPGVVPINASYTRADDGQTFNASYTLTIVDDRDDMATAGAAFSSLMASATYGDATVNTPTISIGKLGNATFTYSSSDESVATVNNSGNVTIKGAGTAEIKASFAGNETFKPGYLTYTLTVAKKEVGLTWGTTEFTYDGSAHIPTATATGLVGNDACTVTVDGAQTNAGSNYIATASALSNANYKLPAVNTISFSIAKATPTVTFASKTANAKMGETYAGQTATTSPAGLVLKYSSSNTGVAKVNESTGAVSLVGAGSTTIKASFDGNTNYNAAEDSYTLTVSKADAVEVELSFASDKVTATYGDGTVSAPSLNNPQQLSLTWSSSNVNVATIGNNNKIQIVGAGQTVISAAFAGDDTYQAKTVSFTLIVNKAAVTVTFDTEAETATLGESFTSPKATITPRDLQLVYSSTDKYIAKVEGSTGEVTLRGVGTVKITATFKGSDNYESASASYELTVLEGTLPPPTLEPIVKEEDYWMDEEFFINADGSEVDLSNTIINDILFTLKNQSSPEGDGYDTEEKCIVINTPTSASTLDALLANGVEPGSEEYASQFTGMTFMVPPGDGYVIVTSQEAEGAYLMAKVGDSEPVAIHMEEMGDYDIPYLSDEITFVYLWKAGTGFSNDVRTRGKKTMSDVKVRGVSHKSKGRSGIQQVYDDAAIDQPWYDLSGQRITKPVKKGVYIHGNRKVVIK